MIIGDDSPLRKRDRAIERKQTVFLDAIQYSVDMADLAHSRLQAVLAAGAPSQEGPSVSVVLDAWSMVDSLHRLRELVDQMPGIKANSPTLQLLLRNTDDVEHLRNGVQHLRGSIDELVTENVPLWGVLNWVIPEPDGRSVQTAMFVSGTLSNYATLPLINPVGKQIRFPADHISLSAYGRSVNLSETMRRYVEPLVRRLEDQVENGSPQRPEDENPRIVLRL